MPHNLSNTDDARLQLVELIRIAQMVQQHAVTALEELSAPRSDASDAMESLVRAKRHANDFLPQYRRCVISLTDVIAPANEMPF